MMASPREDKAPSDEDLDAELADLFEEACNEDSDVELPPSPSPDNAPPLDAASTTQTLASDHELTAAGPPRLGILEHLLEKGHTNLTGTVAGIVRDAENAIANAKTVPTAPTQSNTVAKSQSASKPADGPPQSLAELMRKRRLRSGSAPVLTETQRRKKARNAFAVVGKKTEAAGMRPAFDDERFSGMRLRDSLYAPATMVGLFEPFITINIADVPDKAVEIRAGQLKEYMVFGCLVKKVSKKTAKNGKRYAVWMLSNMPMHTRGKPLHPLTSINCILFDDAFEKYHTQIEGTVFAFRRPSVLPPRDTTRSLNEGTEDTKKGNPVYSGYCISISKAAHILPVAQAANFGICAAENQIGVACGGWYHSARSSLCHHHTKQKLQRQTATRRPVINNAERPGAGRDVFDAANAGVNVSSMDGPAFVNPNYREQGTVKDRDQLLRESRDLEKTNRLRAITLGIRKENRRTGSTSRQTLADFARQQAAKRKVSTVAARPGSGLTGVVGGRRGVDAKERFRRARVSVAGTPAAVRGMPLGPALQAAARSERPSARADPQERYNRARDTLLHLGFKLRKDGGFSPPTMQRRREQGYEIDAQVLPLSCENL